MESGMKTKDRVLEILKASGTEFISGQEMAEKIFVTRAGIWKAIKALEKEGHEIEAVTNRGYRLKPKNDEILPDYIEEELEKRNTEIKVFYFDEVDSTNDQVVRLGREKEGVLLAIAGSQTNGRGRRGRDFFSPKDTGIYMSLLLRGNEPLEKFSGLTATAAVAVAKAIDKTVFAGRDVAKIKWVNDVYIGDRKISGTITEFSTSLEDPTQHSIVMGIGINVYVPKEDIPEDIINKAGTLEGADALFGENVRNNIIIETMDGLFKYMDKKEDTLEIYRAKSNLIGNYVKINSFSERVTENYAKVTGIDEDFCLCVAYDSGKTDKLSTGEVSVVKY